MAPSAGTRSRKKKTPSKKSRHNAAAAATSSISTNEELEVQAPAPIENVQAVPTTDIVEVDVQAGATNGNLTAAASATEVLVPDNTASGEGENGGEQVGQGRIFAAEAEEIHRLNTKGRVVAIYDSVWTMEDTDTIKVYPGYQGETVVFGAISSGPRSNSELTYRAIYSAGPYKAVYSRVSRLTLLYI